MGKKRDYVMQSENDAMSLPTWRGVCYNFLGEDTTHSKKPGR